LKLLRPMSALPPIADVAQHGGRKQRKSTRSSLRRWPLLPSSIIDCILVGCARRHEAPAERPLIIVVETIPRVGRRRRIQKARQFKILQIEEAAGFLDQMVCILFRILLNRSCGARFGAEHLRKRRTIKFVAGRFAALE
jgi:hypothetical protein